MLAAVTPRHSCCYAESEAECEVENHEWKDLRVSLIQDNWLVQKIFNKFIKL